MPDQFNFTEGPVWVPASNKWLFSDILDDTQYQFVPSTGEVSVFRQPSNKSNGMILDNEGFLLTCEFKGRRVIKTNLDTNEITTIADKFNGGAITGPNDITVTSAGVIYFTDPSYAKGAKFGHGMPVEQDFNNVFRYDPATKVLTSVAQDFREPNGLALNADESKLYVAESSEPWGIRAFDIDAEGVISGGDVLVEIPTKSCDGVRVDSLGNIWTSTGAGPGITAFTPGGETILEIKAPATANFAFGGADGTTMLITAGPNVWTIPTKVTNAPRTGPARKVAVQV